MISAQFRLGEPWAFAIEAAEGDASLIGEVTVGAVAVERDTVQSIPDTGPDFTVTGTPYAATDTDPAGWAFEITVEQQAGLTAGLIALDSKAVTTTGDFSFSPAPIFIQITNAAVQ